MEGPVVLGRPGPMQSLAAEVVRTATTTLGVFHPHAHDDVRRGCMRVELSRLLDRHPAARSLFPALVFVERSLRRPGAMERLPTDVVRDASILLTRLARQHGGDGIAMLSTRLRQLHAVRCACDGEQGAP